MRVPIDPERRAMPLDDVRKVADEAERQAVVREPFDDRARMRRVVGER
jgi:hypothetical protein